MIGASTLRIAACLLVVGLAACSEPQQQTQQQAGPNATYQGERSPRLSDQQLEALRTRGALQNF